MTAHTTALLGLTLIIAAAFWWQGARADLHHDILTYKVEKVGFCAKLRTQNTVAYELVCP